MFGKSKSLASPDVRTTSLGWVLYPLVATDSVHLFVGWLMPPHPFLYPASRQAEDILPLPIPPAPLGPNRLRDFFRSITQRRTTNPMSFVEHNKREHRAHPWDRPYNSRCLMSGCSVPVYHDGRTHFSLCLRHLQELELGPFKRRIIEEDYP